MRVNTQIRVISDIQPQLASIVGAGPISLWTRPLRSAVSRGDDSRLFPETQPVPQANDRGGCIRGILWAFGLQAATAILAVVAFKIFHAT
jgi:hypothetical protein